MTSGVFTLECIRSREVGRLRGSDDNDITGCVQRDAKTLFPVVATQIGGVGQDRVDHQEFAAIILSQLKSDLVVGSQHIPAFNWNLQPGLRCGLIDERFAESNLVSVEIDDEIPVVVQLGPMELGFRMPLRLKSERNPGRIRARRHCKIVFKMALVAVIHQVDAGVDFLVLYLGVVWNICVPVPRIASDKVIAGAGKLGKSCHC